MNTFLKLTFVGVAIMVGVALKAQPALAQEAAEPAAPIANPTVTIGHFAPFAADVAGTAVDVRVNGTLVFTNVVYGNFVPDVEFAAGATLVELLAPGTETVVISSTNTLEADKRYYLLAIGGVNTYPVALRWQMLDKVVPTGKSRITVGHLAPFDANIAFTAVNICTDDGEVIIGDLRYGDIRANLDLDPGVYDLKIMSAVLGTCSFLVFDMPPFFLAEGDYRDAFAIGLRDVAAFPPNIVTTTGLMTFFNYLPTVLKAVAD